MMKSHFQNASYVVRHKWFVFRAGLKTKAPLWRLLIHDWSKLTFAEWGPYRRSFYVKAENPAERAKIKADFDRAWLHHIHRNAHHWQHWILREDSGGVKALPMPDHFVREMVADWMGAGRAIHGRWEANSWYQKNCDHMVMHPDTRRRVESLLEAMLPTPIQPRSGGTLR